MLLPFVPTFMHVELTEKELLRSLKKTCCMFVGGGWEPDKKKKWQRMRLHRCTLAAGWEHDKNRRISPRQKNTHVSSVLQFGLQWPVGAFDCFDILPAVVRCSSSEKWLAMRWAAVSFHVFPRPREFFSSLSVFVFSGPWSVAGGNAWELAVSK